MKRLYALAACLAACTINVSASPHPLTLDAMARAAPERSRAQVQENLAANRLLAQVIRMRHSMAQLYPSATVGFDRATALDDQLASLLRAIGGPVEVAPYIQEVLQPGEEQLERVFGKPGRLQLGYALDAAHLALAARVPLLRYALPGRRQAALSVADVFRRQNVQGRMEFFNRNTAFMQQQAHTQVANLLVVALARQQHGSAAVAELRQAIADQDDVRAAMNLYGLAAHAEAASPIQQQLVRDVTHEDIAAHYAANKDQFQRIERVRARHIRVESETLANTLAAQLADGAGMAELARKHSVARDAARGGDLGWVEPAPDQGWLHALVLQQPAGRISNPVRSPEGFWEIVLVEQRIDGLHPPESETVRYLARKAIAQERAARAFDAMRSASAPAARP